jgi:spore coat polysaccharide biosynthesis predicted glycosyltransferase SpsG
MNILARVDVSETVGFGHLFRTIEISKYFKGSKIIFLINSSNKKIYKILKEKKISFKIIKSKKITSKYIEKIQTKNSQSVDANKTVKIAKYYNAKLIVVDDYKKDYIWHKIIKNNNINLAVIDDLNNKKFFCDFYINFNKEKKEIRKNLLLKKCKIITGRTNNPFIYKNFRKKYNDKIDRIHLCLSSAVKKKFVLDIIKTLNDFQKKNKPEMKLKLNVFCTYYDFSIFQKLNFNFLNIRYFNNSKNYLDDIKKADLGIGFAGMSMFDRISNLLPSLNFAISKNQTISLEDDYLKKFMYTATLKKNVSYKDKIKKQIEFFLKNKKLRKKIFKNLNKLPKKLNLKIKNL